MIKLEQAQLPETLKKNTSNPNTTQGVHRFLHNEQAEGVSRNESIDKKTMTTF